MDDGTISGGDISAAYSAAEEASPASPASDTTPATSTGADTTDPLAATATPGGPTPTQTGVPPEHRWPSILENARNEWKQQYGWAEQVNREDLEEVVEIARLSKEDPVAYVQKVIADLQDDPQHGPRLRSMAARALQQGRGQQQPPQSGPLPVIELEDGSRLDMNAVLAAQAEQLRREYAPALSAAQKLQLAEDKVAADGFATDLTSELQGFDKNVHGAAMIEAVKREIAKYPKGDSRADTPEFLSAATLRAYMKVVVPTLGATARKTALAEAGQKAHANTVNPGQQRTAAPVELKDMSWADALRAQMAAAK